MATLNECAIVYSKLLGKNYNFTLENNIKFMIEFKPSNFYHLLGLEKLKDVSQLQNKDVTKIYKDILKNRIKDSTIKSSKHYNIIKDRVDCFNQIMDLLYFDKSNKIIIDYDVNKLNFHTKLKFTKYILYKRDNENDIHLTIGCQNKLYPETFFVESGSTYISDQIMLDILNIEVVDIKHKRKKSHTDR